ncbi:Uncharacterised protein [Mycobacteroides abscessus subsp. massiliense]|uniref:hypothetical protein n=1 Tax=Mycobacteroides abscessus TaxID=36809 RepID=UPI0009A61292|nr:hypothetical protein [Mycobacteroides abscessus]MDO3055637.1 hypothetical protein [Mycobacteroides abscessus subsp. massiliense]SLC38422.1 Uncharacterised protein [Mycobacteroides abscessus subsp. massiliense]SLH30199.1 Uncharacterised protein [Mycobacteroides abscessus subsp. massiliense]SLI03570.1 Uncharacterised protein [Mycobacteroides abscessus subsp. massiliense]
MPIAAPEIGTDTDAITEVVQQLNGAADELEAVSNSLGTVPDEVQGAADSFNDTHEPAGVYMVKVGDLKTTVSGLQHYAAAQAAKLRHVATALTGHATNTEQQEDNSAESMEKIPATEVSAPAVAV